MVEREELTRSSLECQPFEWSRKSELRHQSFPSTRIRSLGLGIFERMYPAPVRLCLGPLAQQEEDYGEQRPNADPSLSTIRGAKVPKTKMYEALDLLLASNAH